MGLIDKRQRKLLAIFDATTGQDRNWRLDAACATEPPDLWFPTTPDHRHQWDYPRSVCLGRCPVQPQCLAYALAAGEQHGMFGGFTPEERQRLASRQEDVA